MSLLDRLADESAWAEFREYKSRHSLLSRSEFDRLDKYVAEKRYLPYAESLTFSPPDKREISKSGSSKKRVVYIFPEDETWILKLLTWLLYKYDYAFEPSCYSFRRDYTAKTAFGAILKTPDLNKKYVLKLDIHDYFNSMPTDGLIREFERIITDDPKLLTFMIGFFTADRSIRNGTVIEEKRGAMAGCPLSSFCANIYLADLDRHFADQGIPYFRYSDDILVLLDSQKELDNAFEEINDHIQRKGLTLNPSKIMTAKPGEPWDFLGFGYRDGDIDLAQSSIRKMKGRIRRKGRALYRWRIRKDADYDRTAKAMIRKFNRKFYDVDEESEFTWSKWFFPVLTRTDGLHILDSYLIEYLRFLYSGRHYKGNYAISYDHLKELGFRSLVNEYYKYRSACGSIGNGKI